MIQRHRPAAILLAAPLLTATVMGQGPMVRVGLDSSAVEWIVSLEGGGSVCDLGGRKLLTLRDGEKLRIWWDGKGESDPTSEYRVQVGPPAALKDAEALMARLRSTGEQPARVRVADGDTWRVLDGHYDHLEDAEPLLAKLRNLGIDELWVSSESIPAKARKGRALYAITESYERRALPGAGVWLRPRGELVALQGKGRYRGKVELIPNPQSRLTVINTLDMETYLRGVVPREMGAWEYPNLEALKAQAVAARTYATANLGKRNAEGFDLTDTVSDQVYGGRDGEQTLTDQAVKETEGLVATYNGQPIQALFMADCGGHTIDVSYVFGGEAPYLRAASCYPAMPLTRSYRTSFSVAPEGDSTWLAPELLKLVAVGALGPEQLRGDLMKRPARVEDLEPVLRALQQRLGLEAQAGPRPGNVLLALARGLRLNALVEGQERSVDAAYFIPSPMPPEDRLLAGFLTRRGMVPATFWSDPGITRGQALGALARMWLDLEPTDWTEGTLLLDGQVRPKKQGPQALPLAGQLLVVEESPGGALRLAQQSDIQVGDRLRWIPQDGGARVLLRRLDPDGAAWDRYNPTAHWRQEIAEADLMALLRKRLGGIGSLRELKPTWNAEGRVTELTVVDGEGRSHKLSGMRIRGLLGLKDNVFRFLVVGKAPARRWVFFGRGWGHGVGMCQTGAYGMALEGATFDQILKHYYTGIELRQASELSKHN
ncbi:MAG TPA: SpoIID/LytB domain-containing protein [Holophagaceae bacterium]|nr:SpoIID/LytB domain-containing protein [Holophagaceae bacterium]